MWGHVLIENRIKILVQVVCEPFLADGAVQHAYEPEQNGTIVCLHHQQMAGTFETERGPGQVRQADVHTVKVVHLIFETVRIQEHRVLHDH